MAVHLQTAEISKDAIAFDNLKDAEKEPILPDSVDVNAHCTDTSQESRCKTEGDKLSLDPLEDNVKFNKTLNVREVHETSPFRQAVKGFVLNKLSKKVGSSHILSGITEKIVKKLEDKDNVQPGLVPSSESDLNISSLRTNEQSVEVITTSVSCELKSVVANDLGLPEVLNVEDAIECLEDAKPLEDSGINIPHRPEIRSLSISLPSSPAHRLDKRSSSVGGSLENVESTSKQINSSDLLFLNEEKNLNEMLEEKLIDSSQLNENELEIKNNPSSAENQANSDVTYLSNLYSSEKDPKPEFSRIFLRRVFTFFSYVKNVFVSLSLSHLFLLASVVIHNINIISPYLAFAFDGLVIAYICYSYICILAQKPLPNPTQSFPFMDLHLENTSIQKTNKTVKGSVKVLKGEYDPEMVKNHPTDLVDISIEDSCLKIFSPKKKNKDMSSELETFISFNLQGASISLVPKDLPKRRVWNKKYPICIAFPLSKSTSSPDGSDNVDTSSSDCLSAVQFSADYLSAIYKNDDTMFTSQKALYFFSLTDREKESLFWALHYNIKEVCGGVKCNEKPSDTSSKLDLSSICYTTLLESNQDDSLSFSKDIPDDESSSLVDETNSDLNFDVYMKNLFENFERMQKFTPRSRRSNSFEDLKNFKEDLSRSSETFMSKDDTYLLSNTSAFSVDWLNIVFGRIFYDFLTQKFWSDHVKDRIQKKLNKIEMPTFIESLEVSDVFLGTSLPQLHTVSNPVADINGVWLSFDFNYCGSFQMTLTTKLKISKDRPLSSSETMDVTETKSAVIPTSESDDDEDDSKIKIAKKKKLINRIEKWITHKHFQTVTQNRFVKKYVGDISNMPLILTVELNTLHGTLTLNIPPAPTDRIWYGFRKDPVLSLNAYPKVGTREINLSAVVQMIEKKLIQEFKKALVMPNMDDILIPVMYTPIYNI